MSSIFTNYWADLSATPGLLPKWMLFVSVLSIFNTAQCYITTTLNQRIYPRGSAVGEVTPLSSRTFGTWTLLTGIVRLFASTRLREQAWFDLAYATYAVALGHFGLEVLVYKTSQVRSGVFPSLCVATGTLVWMGVVRASYIGA